jgi:hypothetical protein
MHLDRSADSDTEIENVLENLTPQLMKTRSRGWLYAFFVAVIACPATYWAWEVASDSGGRFFPAILMVIGLGYINLWVARKQQRLVMPFLARSAGFEYEQNGALLMKELPPRLLPKARVRPAEDWITGSVAKRRMSLVEMHLKTAGKHQKTLFHGFVIRFENAIPMPAFFVAQESHANYGPFSTIRIEVDDLVHVETFSRPSGTQYGVWTSKAGADAQHPGLQAVINALGEMEQSARQQSELFSATSNGIEMHVALSHKRNLFYFGGLLATKTRVLKGIQSAAADFNIPISLVENLIEVERQALMFSEDKKTEGEAR